MPAGGFQGIHTKPLRNRRVLVEVDTQIATDTPQSKSPIPPGDAVVMIKGRQLFDSRSRTNFSQLKAFEETSEITSVCPSPLRGQYNEDVSPMIRAYQ